MVSSVLRRLTINNLTRKITEKVEDKDEGLKLNGKNML